jgi:formylglycine-generating enzyme
MVGSHSLRTKAFDMLKTLAIISIAVCSGSGSLEGASGDSPKDSRVPLQIVNAIGMKLTLIPSGEFNMGCGESPQSTYDYFAKKYRGDAFFTEVYKAEHPRHRVRITRPFYLGTYPVTRGQFRKFVDETKYVTKAEGTDPGAVGMKDNVYRWDAKFSWRNPSFDQTDDHPVVDVTWDDAAEFCKWLSKKDKAHYRLPTEAEWEYACRAGTTTRYYFGDDPEILAKFANVADGTYTTKYPHECAIKARDGYVFTSPVGRFLPNAFGLYDMHGNVDNMCSDWYSEDYYQKSPVDDPKGPPAGEARVTRGGAWLFKPDVARSAFRGRLWLGGRSAATGFRVVKEVEEVE